MKKIYYTLVFSLFSCILSLTTSCRDDETSIPECEVYVKTSYSEYSNLLTANHAVTYPYNGVYPSNFKLGFGGIVIFRDLEGKICSCDLACPYEALRTVSLHIEMPYAVCPECGSKFDLTYGFGNPVNGPADCGLKVYDKIRDTGEYILVTN